MLIQCLSVRQPWASLIIAGIKTVENRPYSTPLRGTIAIHASGEEIKQTYRLAQEFVRERGLNVNLPAIEDLPTGVIIGLVDVVDCVKSSNNPWFTGPFGYTLSRPRRGPIKPLQAEQGFSHVSYPHFGNCQCGGAVLRPGLDGFLCEFCGSNRACIKCGRKLGTDEFLCIDCNKDLSKQLNKDSRRKR